MSIKRFYGKIGNKIGLMSLRKNSEKELHKVASNYKDGGFQTAGA